MNLRLIGTRSPFNAVLVFSLAAMFFFAGCVPPKQKTPKGEDVTSAQPAPTPAEKNPLTDVWRRLAALEGKSAGFGSIAIGNVLAQNGGEGASAKNHRVVEASMDVTGRLPKSFVEALLSLDVSPARVTAVEVSASLDETSKNAATEALLADGKVRWRMRQPEGQALRTSQRLFLRLEVPYGTESVELHAQRSFRNARGDMFNTISSAPDTSEAQRLADMIQKELSKRAKGFGSDVFWAGVDNCALVQGQEKNGQCYPTEESWRMAERRVAVLFAAPWQETLKIKISGRVVLPKKADTVVPPEESPKPVEEAKPAQAAQPDVEEARPVEISQPAEDVKPVETPKPVEEAKPAEGAGHIEGAKPAETPKPVEEAKPIESPKPVEASKPAIIAHPADTQKPAATPKSPAVAKPAPAAKPAMALKPKPSAAPKAKPEEPKKAAGNAEPKKPTAGGGKPLYDLSDVLGK